MMVWERAKPRTPPTPGMTLATLPDLSKITSLMSPIFSFASLYTSTWTELGCAPFTLLVRGSTGTRSHLVCGCLRRRRAGHRRDSQECYCKTRDVRFSRFRCQIVADQKRLPKRTYGPADHILHLKVRFVRWRLRRIRRRSLGVTGPTAPKFRDHHPNTQAPPNEQAGIEVPKQPLVARGIGPLLDKQGKVQKNVECKSEFTRIRISRTNRIVPNKSIQGLRHPTLGPGDCHCLR